MKKFYDEPVIEIVEVTSTDVIVCSDEVELDFNVL